MLSKAQKVTKDFDPEKFWSVTAILELDSEIQSSISLYAQTLSEESKDKYLDLLTKKIIAHLSKQQLKLYYPIDNRSDLKKPFHQYVDIEIIVPKSQVKRSQFCVFNKNDWLDMFLKKGTLFNKDMICCSSFWQACKSGTPYIQTKIINPSSLVTEPIVTIQTISASHH